MNKNKHILTALLLTIAYLSFGFLCLHYGLIDYGWVFFILLPYSLGIAIGSIPRREWAYVGCAIGILLSILFLLLGGLEGIVCVIMALPIIIPLVWLGVLTKKYLIRKGFGKPSDKLKTLAFPLIFLFLGGPLEYFLNTDKIETVVVQTERIYPFSPEKVYDGIKSMDTLIAEKPFLMKLDLPIPNKCILEKEEIGGLRTCYFSGGVITERITALEKGKILKMDVIDYQLTGRKWLGFKEAIYTFERIGTDSCKLIRTTTYTSVLKPRFYWEPLERLGIQQEHEYVLNSLNYKLK